MVVSHGKPSGLQIDSGLQTESLQISDGQHSDVVWHGSPSSAHAPPPPPSPPVEVVPFAPTPSGVPS